MTEITQYVNDFTNPKEEQDKNNDLDSSMAETDNCCDNNENCECNNNGDDPEPPKNKSPFYCRWFGLGC